tara:strand:- start:226 stop:729 length:504 start_codon:yes stop_codon:yes gene_type:complete
MRDNGRFRNEGVMGVAGNFRLSEFQASIALLNLKQFDDHQMNRMEMAEKYLDSFEQLEQDGLIELPYGFAESGNPVRNHTYHLFCVKLLKNDVNEIIQKMKEKEIGCTVAYGNLVSDYILGDDDAGREYPVARELTETLIALPMSQYMDGRMTQKVIDSFLSCLRGE